MNALDPSRRRALGMAGVSAASAVCAGWAAGALPVGSTAAEFTKFSAAERQRWKPVIARAKVKPD